MKLQHLLRNFVLVAVFGAFALAVSSPAHAGSIPPAWVIWTQWTNSQPGSSASGNIAGNQIYYFGTDLGFSSVFSPTNYPGYGGAGTWDPSTSWTGGGATAYPQALVNAPNTSYDSIAIDQAPATETIYFTDPVTDPIMAIWSLGDSGGSAEFIFTGEPFTIIAGGPSAQYPLGISITTLGETVYGTEGSGTIEFTGTYGNGINGYAPLTFTNPDSENFYSFTLGEQTPEPETLSLLGLGLLALPLLRASLARRRRA